MNNACIRIDNIAGVVRSEKSVTYYLQNGEKIKLPFESEEKASNIVKSIQASFTQLGISTTMLDSYPSHTK